MQTDELFRSVPANIHELRLARWLAGKHENYRGLRQAFPKKTVEELRARTAWPPGLVITTPRKLRPKSVLKISRAIQLT